MKLLSKLFFAVMIAATIMITSCATGDVASVKVGSTQADSVSYALGLLFSQNTTEFEDINAMVVAKGFNDGMTDVEGAMFTLQDANMYIQQYMESKEKAKSAGVIEAGTAFLAENAAKEGVVTLASGLQYEIISEGTGPKPTLADQVVAHYHGTLIDGTVFDSSVERGEPATFPVSGVISGWTEALQMMPTGSKWRLYIPDGLAYGKRSPSPKIPAYSTLIFDVELLEVISGE